MELSYALYQYAKLFEKTGVGILASWPGIKLRQKVVNPLLASDKRLKKMLKCGLRSPNQFAVKEFSFSDCLAINSKGEIITKSKSGKNLKLWKRSTEEGHVGLSVFGEDVRLSNSFEILAFAVSLDDSVYMVTRYREGDAFFHKLYVLNANLGHVEQQLCLECLTGPGENHHAVCVAVDANKNVYITKQNAATVYILDRSGKMKNTFTIPSWNLIKDLESSGKEEIIASELVGKKIGIFNQDGCLKKEITLPSLHKVCGIAFDYIDNTIVVLSKVLTGCFHEHSLLSYSESAELMDILTLPRHTQTTGYQITSHQNGPFVVVHETGVLFLH